MNLVLGNIQGLFGGKIGNLLNKKRKGFSLPEILLALVVVVSLSVAVFFSLDHVQQTRKMAQMNTDMEALANGCLAYEALNIDSLPPATLADLTTGLTAEESVDGIAHTDFVTSTKAVDGAFTDPWGQTYEYDQAARTITCTPKDASGSAMTAVVRNF